jgi:hypothetical protein
VIYRGVRLISRYNDLSEIKLMRDIVRSLELNARYLTELFYDSKACADLTIAVRKDTKHLIAQDIAEHAKAEMQRQLGGWNSIRVTRGKWSNESIVEIDPWWDADDYELDPVGYLMRTENIDFCDAVNRLAADGADCA